MTNSATSAGWGSGDRSASGWWGHLAPQVLIAAIVTSVVLVVRPLPSGTPAAALTPLLLVALVITTWLLMRRHDRSLCELCMASMPLDASAAAGRYQRRFAVAHLASNRKALITMVGALLLFDLVLVIVPPSLLQPVSYAWAGAQLSLVYLVLAHTTHRRLQPWCPQCSDGGGGSDETVPEPSPSGFSSR